MVFDHLIITMAPDDEKMISYRCLVMSNWLAVCRSKFEKWRKENKHKEYKATNVTWYCMVFAVAMTVSNE